MEEQQKRLITVLLEHLEEYGPGFDGDPLNNPEDLEELRKKTLMDDLGFDSLATVELTMHFEDELEVELPDALYQDLAAEEYTVGRFLDIAIEQASKIRIGR